MSRAISFCEIFEHTDPEEGTDPADQPDALAVHGCLSLLEEMASALPIPQVLLCACYMIAMGMPCDCHMVAM